MKGVATLSILAFIGVSWVLGLRLLALARTTRQMPELCMGASLILIGGFGYPFAIVTNLPAVQGTLWGALAFTACSWTVHGGVAATFLFVFRVFRADAPLVRSAIRAACVLLVLTAIAQSRVAFSGLPREAMMAANLWPAVGLLTMAVLAYAWSAVESLRYWRMMRRRQARAMLVLTFVPPRRYLAWLREQRA